MTQRCAALPDAPLPHLSALHWSFYAASPPSSAVTITEIGGHVAETTFAAPPGARGHDDRNKRSRSPKYATSRPKLLSAVGRMISLSGQKKILLTITHEAAAQIKRLVVNVRAGLQHVRQIAPQLDKSRRWYALVRYITEQILASQPRRSPLLPALASG